ncbi:MAG: hypothetical protein EOP45_14270 [Sphingobacteriaceae bacterium]|nr:MAG: hypothetical protein EOP45_14270 [Sphingobacteriaceae bacterium]
MKSVICTLFEGHYHYGVAALTNSLYLKGYRGIVYAGYRGELPSWAASANQNPVLPWPSSRSLEVSEGLKIHFLPFDSEYHFSNCKAEFMLQVWDGLASDATAMFYIDPDIVITTPWAVLEDWVNYGVAVCEDVNSPLSEHHPIRTAWRRYFEPQGFKLRFKDAIYANAGFLGVSAENRGFLVTWQAMMEAMAPAIGGLSQSGFTSEEPSLFAPFGNADQDAMNATVEAWDGVVSMVGKEGMALTLGTSLMSHALGKNKPWQWKPLAQVARGWPPRRADRDYWYAAGAPIMAQPISLIRRRQFEIKVAAFIGRFYRR